MASETASSIKQIGLRWACPLLLLAAMLNPASLPGSDREVVRSIAEKIKAAYLLNFTRYVEWPSTAFADTSSPFVVCIMGRVPAREVLERTFANRYSGGRVITSRFPEPGETRDQCHVIFFSMDVESRVKESLSALSGKPILTVGESETFLQQGGMVALVLAQDTLRFDVNLKQIRTKGLSASSQMLAVARRIHDD